MFNRLKEWLSSNQRISLGKQILQSVNVQEGLNSDNRQKLDAFLELTNEVGYSSESRASSNSLSSIVAHLDDRPLVVTRNLVSALMKESNNNDRA